MRCTVCRHENREERRFCAECGNELGWLCSACSAENEPGEKFCGRCGAKLTEVESRQSRVESGERENSQRSTLNSRFGADRRAYTSRHLAEKILQSKSALEGERKQVTVLFA